MARYSNLQSLIIDVEIINLKGHKGDALKKRQSYLGKQGYIAGRHKNKYLVHFKNGKELWFEKRNLARIIKIGSS